MRASITTKLLLLLAVFVFLLPMATPAFSQNLGHIFPPPGVNQYQAEAGLTHDQPALIFFLSRMIRLITVVVGLWVIVNITIAAFHYISGSGSAEAHAKVRNLLTMSVAGLLLIIASYTIGGILGLIFFGDATYILNPTI